MNWRRIGLICLFDLQQSVFRIKGLLFLVFYFLFWFSILRKVDENVTAWFQSMEVLVLMSAWLDADLVQLLFVKHPPLLSSFFIISLTTLPMFALLAGNDQLSTDLGEGYFRFLSTRCKRIEIFTGRYLGSFCLIGASLLLMGLICTGYTFFYDKINSMTVVLIYLLQIELMLLLYAAALIAYMAIISALVKSAIASLILGGGSYMLILFFTFIANSFHGDTELYSYLLPGSLKSYLLQIDSIPATTATAALVLYTLVYSYIGWLIFKKRNF